MKTKGMLLSIYRDNYKSSINLMRDNIQVVVIDQNLPEIFDPSESSPAVKLVTRDIYGKKYTHAEPMQPGFYAFGGSFIYTSDSRFREVCQHPIPLHDRQMNLE